jgi:hypothetical protein
LGQVEELEAHEEPEHGAAKRLGQPRRVMDRPRHERAVGPEPAVGDEQMQVGMPVGTRAVRLQAGNDADREGSRSPVSVRIAAVTGRAATRAISPSRRRRYRQ